MTYVTLFICFISAFMTYLVNINKLQTLYNADCSQGYQK